MKKFTTTTANGHRLKNIEIYNWGTFDQQIWNIPFEGKNVLLTGSNGSGKSTIVDALLTLLVPNKKRNYNLSSGNDRKERSEATYIKGAYGKEKNEFGQAKSKFIRKENQYSVLLATFSNEYSHDLIMLGQVFWFEDGNLKKFFLTSHKELTVEKHFNNFKNPSELRNNLKKIATTDLYNTFSEYEECFIRHFGLKSSKATDLFNQVAAIKEIGQLNDFVRKHMLEENQTSQEALEQLYLDYENLSIAHKAIISEKDQLELLKPIFDDAMEMKKIENKKNEAEVIKQQVPMFFRDKKLAILEKLKAEYKSILNCENAELKQINQELDLFLEQKNNLLVLTSNDQRSQQIDQINLTLKQYQEKKEIRQQYCNRYLKMAEKLQLSTELSIKNFNNNQNKAKEQIETTKLQISSKQELIYSLRKEVDEREKEIEHLLQEIEGSQKHHGRLPANYLMLRDDLAHSLSIAPQNLPFVAELIQVKKEEPLWKNVIEKVLFSFAQRLLVPEECYNKINHYLNKNKINLKLVYSRIDLARTNTESFDFAKIGKNSLFFKLDYHAKSTYRKWVQGQIAKEYNFECVEDIKHFQQSNKAIMPSGLIKRSFHLHEKDDRKHLENQKSILGWDNKSKILEIREEYITKTQEKENNNKKIATIKKEIIQLETLTQMAQSLLLIEDYNSIDWEFFAQEIEKINKQKEKLKSKDYSSSKMRNDLDTLEIKIKKLYENRDVILSKIAVTENELKKIPKQEENCQAIGILDLNDNDNTVVDFSLLEKLFSKKKLDNKNIEELNKFQKELEDTYIAKSKEFDIKIQYQLISLIKKMSNFKNKFLEQSSDLHASVEYLDDFLKLKEKIEKEALPEHERRFKNLLNKSVINNMASFKTTLELGYESIEEDLEHLNSSLKQIDYTDNTYVELQVNKSRDPEIREFQHLLKNALKSIDKHGNEIDVEESFKQIQMILNKLKKEERWCKKVIDVRNWADFNVLELTKDTKEQQNFYADSAGLSGGQKAKLAFTILASAIAYQYGLHGSKVDEKSFRFVVIDEAFSKSDEKNSKYAMELFNRLNLQLMVVTPKDKIHIVEPYVNNILVTKINEQQNYSQMINIPIEEFNNHVQIQ